MKYTVYIRSGCVRVDLFDTLNEQDAQKFCSERNWTWIDSNEFAWDLDYEIDDGEA